MYDRVRSGRNGHIRQTMPNIDANSVLPIAELKEKAAEIRLLAVDAVGHAKSGHPGGSLSVADLIAYLYFYKMKVDPADPKWPDRDRFVLSKGHCCPALYAALLERFSGVEAAVEAVKAAIADHTRRHRGTAALRAFLKHLEEI